MKIKELKAQAREHLLGNYTTLAVAKLLQNGLVAVGVFAILFFLLLGCFYAGIGPLFRIIPVTAGGSAVLAAFFFLLSLAASAGTLLLQCWLNWGFQSLVLSVGRGRRGKTAQILRFFRREEHPWKVLGTLLLTNAFIALNAVIPGMVYACGEVCGADFHIHGITNIWYVALLAAGVLSFLWALYLAFAFAFAGLLMIEDGEMDLLDALRGSMKLTRKKKLKMVWLYCFSFLFWEIPLALVPLTGLWIIPYRTMTFTRFYLSCREEAGMEELPVPAASAAGTGSLQAAAAGTAGTAEASETAGTAEASETAGTAAEVRIRPAAEETGRPASADGSRVPSETSEEDGDPESAPTDFEKMKRIKFPDIDAEPETPEEEVK